MSIPGNYKVKNENESSYQRTTYEGTDGALRSKDNQEEITATAEDDFKETKQTFTYRLGKQILLFFIWIGIGLFLETTGPCLQDIMVRVKSNYEEISQALIGKSVGVFIGAILGGYLCDRLSRHVDMLMSISLGVAAIATVFVPWSNQLGLLAFIFLLQGVAEGVINAGGNAMTLNLWGESAASPMHSLHFGFGIGAIVAPQLARPFLIDRKALNSTGNWSGPTWNDSTIEIPYLGIAIYVFILALIVMAVYIKGPPKGFRMRTPKANEVQTKLSEIVNPATCTQGSMGTGFIFFILLFIYFIQGSGGERAYGKFLFSYAKDEAGFDNDKATSLNSVFWAVFTAGRACSILIARVLKVQLFMTFDNILVLVVAIVLAIWANQIELILWIFTGALGFSYAPIFPNGFAWANRYLDMTSTAVCLCMMGGACGGFIYQYLTGYLFERNRHSLMYVEVGHAVALMLVFIAMSILGHHRGEKFNKSDKKEEENEAYDMQHVTKE